MIIKIDDSKIERQINTEIFFKTSPISNDEIEKNKFIKKIKVKLALPVNRSIDFLKFNNMFF